MPSKNTNQNTVAGVYYKILRQLIIINLCLALIDRIINSSMRTQLKQQHIKKTLPTEFHSLQEDTDKDSSLTHFYYDTFAFRDRLTNKHFQYKQARRNKNKKQNINLQEWTKNQSSIINRELKASLNVYKYTKKFQINCIRSKYLRQTYNEKLLKERQDKTKCKQYSKDSNEISRERLYQINKGEMKRILQKNQHVSPDILELNRSRKYEYSMSKNKNNFFKLKFINNHNFKQNDSFTLDQIEKRQTQKIMNHMKNQIKSNCQYLLNLPMDKKKKNIFKNQLKNYKNEQSYLSKFNHSEIEQCKFNSYDESVSFDVSQIKNGHKKEDKSGNNQLINLVRKGYMNEVFLQIKDNQHSALTKDQSGNNIFHIVAKQGNIDMGTNLLKIIPTKTCLMLLFDKNRLKRTPKDKALMLGYKDIANLFDQFINENRHIIL